jgi:hypothetical protein
MPGERPTVILTLDRDGGWDLDVCGDVRVLVLQPTCFADPLFEYGARCAPARIAEILAPYPVVGHSGDGVLTPNMRQAIVARASPGLRVVE